MKTTSNHSPDVESEASAAVDVWPLCHVVRRRLWLIAVCAFAGLLLGAAYALIRADVFEATATVQVEQETPSVVSVEDAAKNGKGQADEDLKTVEGQLLARGLIWRVLQANKIDESPQFNKPGLLRRIFGQPVTQSDKIDRLLREYSVKVRRGTRLIDITVSHKSDPKMAQALARSLIEEYVSQNVEWLASPSNESNRILIDEAERLKLKVERAEQSLQDYREKNRAVSLDEKQNIIVERLKNLNLRMAQAENDRIAIESDLAQLEKIGNQSGKLLAIGTIANVQSVLDVQRLLTEKEAAFAVLKQRYGTENPAYAQAERELRLVRAMLDAAALNAADSLRAKYEAAKFTQQMAEKVLREQEQVALDLNRMSIRYDVLSREVEADRALFATVIKRLTEMGVNRRINQLHLRIVDPPMLPDSSNQRIKLLIAALGLFGGTAIGFGVVLAQFALRPAIESPGHGEAALCLPALGAIPPMSGLNRDIGHFPGIASPRSPASESFRFLAASMPCAHDGGGTPSLLLTSANCGDGNTTCAIGCAIAFAQSGVRTLLIDANLRNPAIGRLFSLSKEGDGLTDCLAGRSTLDASILPTKVANLFVLTAGAAPSEIASLFSGSAFCDLIGRAAREFGKVVIDSAPVNSASETLMIARHAGAACIVTRRGRTTVRAASRACQLLEGAGCRPSGFIANRVPRRMIA